MTSIRLSTIEIPVDDLNSAIEWYEKVFPLSTVWSDDNHAMLENSQDDAKNPRLGVRFLLVQTADSSRLVFKSTGTKIRHSVIDFECNDLEGFHSHLSSINVDVQALEPPANDWAPRGFPFFDPFGNCFGVFTYIKSNV